MLGRSTSGTASERRVRTLTALGPASALTSMRCIRTDLSRNRERGDSRMATS